MTGGAGFIGSHLCERLLARGCRVVCVDNFSTSVWSNVQHLTQRPDFRLLRWDVTRPVRVSGTVDAVYHLASPASPRDYLAMPLETLRTGALGTWNTLELAEQHRARYLLVSASASYGNPQVHPQPEGYWGNVNPVGPSSVYDEAKRYAEALTTAYRQRRDVDAKIVRVFHAFGPRMRLDDGRAIPTFVRQALLRQPITVTGRGTQSRSPCYVADIVDGLLAMMDSDASGPLNLGSPHELSMRQLAHRIARLAGSPAPIRLVPRRREDPERQCPDITAARRVLRWEPRTPLDIGLGLTVNWFRQQLRVDRALPPTIAPEPAGSG
ncbi:SDR family NAD-dependent epimerase/dehydratase [Streptacidiphilus pinicola]|uniref:SDR family NAD-dependent epimerase/dehydratase n=1 Tax=Streptacidiphilus pinicola TaxID=2219663 RepID=A0A2X0IM48_9ACTN|nr:SDR family NAD-dependent epimerase/dehydratase [Streptacidiphilus pinicola]